MAPTDAQRAKWNRYWDKKSASYDREMGFFDRHLFGDSRQWVCSQATGTVLEVAVGTGLNLGFYPDDIQLTGIDWSRPMLDLAEQRAAELGRTPPCGRRTPTIYRSMTPASTPSSAPSDSAPFPTTPRPSRR